MNDSVLEVKKNKEEITNIILKIIEKGSNYIIKSMPVNKHVKEILVNVKDSFGDSDIKGIIKVAIDSSIKEGIEILGIKEGELVEIEKMVTIAFKGGLPKSINLGVGTIENVKKYGNIFFNYIEDFFNSLKRFIASSGFETRVHEGINKCLNKVEEFKDMCNDWYDAYDKFDLNDLKDIASKLDKMKKKVSFNNNCLSENTIIQNVTELVSRKNGKLTKTQFDICSNLEKL